MYEVNKGYIFSEFQWLTATLINVCCNDKPTFKTVKVFGVLSTQRGNLSSSSTFTCEK